MLFCFVSCRVALHLSCCFIRTQSNVVLFVAVWVVMSVLWCDVVQWFGVV